MTDDEWAAFLMESLSRHQSRGVIYGDQSSGETVVHGRFDFTAVAADLRGAVVLQDAQRSWSGWFAARAHQRRREQVRHEQAREREAASAAARERLRLRAEGAD